MVYRCKDNISIVTIRIAIWCERILSPVILSIGWSGNFMLYRTMQNKLYRSTHMSVFFKALAIVHSILLLIDLGRWLEALGLINIYKVTDCGWLFFVKKSAQQISNYIMLLHNLDRSVFVMCPDISLKYFDQKCCKIYCILIAIITILIMSHWPYILHFSSTYYLVSGTPCKYHHHSEMWGNVGWPIFYNLFGIAIPFIGILVCTSLLIRFVRRSRKRIGRRLSHNQRKGLRNTIILSLFYIVCSFPFALLQCLTRLVNFSKSCRIHTLWFLTNSILFQLLCFGYSVTFYLLASQSSIIRENLLMILRNENIEMIIRQAKVCESPTEAI
ncbi:hypothetical protein GJ496_002463 [Pomphorhynchus laevis]|nr:hypothetical protein GJ496_010686 [Pomphorhynchus laevis]KAI0986448.1 hypothetical protein GJ496_002463 [Pomphorhynchus laevis]